jgi:PAS domain S-box-containing protein
MAHAQAVNLSPAELVGKTALEVFPAHLAAQFHADDQHIMRSGKALLNLERSTVDEHGDTKTVLTSKIPLKDQEGRVTGLVGISRDITERTQLEAQTLELESERTRMRVLERFINDMSHDFRTPLTIINSSLYLIQRSADPEKRHAHIQNMEQQIMRLDKLLSEALQMTHLDQPELNLSFDLIDINSLLKPLTEEYGTVAAAKQIHIHFASDTATCFARADAVEFTRAIIALLENALAYTPEAGSIRISTALEAEHTLIVVQDSGIGIGPKDLPHIFERFYRADQARSTETGGHGLGLSIARRIV